MAVIILSGGLSKRMGQDKASLVLEDSTLLQTLIARFAGRFGPVIVVSRPGQDLAIDNADVVRDIHVGKGPLGGLHAGLLASPDDANFVLACDMPFADVELANYVLSRLNGHDAAIPLLERGPEPLFAAYRRSCLPTIEANLEAGILAMRGLLDKVDTLYLPESDLRQHDPTLRSFLNINTPDEYLEVRRMDKVRPHRLEE